MQRTLLSLTGFALMIALALPGLASAVKRKKQRDTYLDLEALDLSFTP